RGRRARVPASPNTRRGGVERLTPVTWQASPGAHLFLAQRRGPLLQSRLRFGRTRVRTTELAGRRHGDGGSQEGWWWRRLWQEGQARPREAHRRGGWRQGPVPPQGGARAG